MPGPSTKPRSEVPALASSQNTTLTNPTTGEEFPAPTVQGISEVDVLLDAAHTASRAWGNQPIHTRAQVVKAAAALLRKERDLLARTITLEMGKPLAESLAEVEKSAWNCEYVAEQAADWLADRVVPTNAALSYVAHRPLGVVLSILPWNFPVWQIFRCAASALMAGNAVVLKHAPNVPQCAAHVTDLLHRAGVPRGVFQDLIIPVDRIAAVIKDPRISAVTFTGSPGAGAAVAASAGAACKKSILELGGSDPFIVLEDADLDAAVAAAVRARFSNCGQVCLASKRFIISDACWSDFNSRFVKAVAALRVGNPLDAQTQIGPMARRDLRDALDDQVQRSIAKGARLLVGGHALPGPGYFYAPAVLTDVEPSNPAAIEETFGPVAPLLRAHSAQHAVELANDSRYGLGAVIWTRDIARARELAGQIQSGSVAINAVTASDPRLPVGGVKLSGYGRELGEQGIRELVNVQSVVVGPLA
jgi:succinate-semialdehyde dehydrogenase / glutarate-semialdehyde dehydrogenase